MPVVGIFEEDFATVGSPVINMVITTGFQGDFGIWHIYIFIGRYACSSKY